jgi:hypothetical protein
LKLKLFMWLVVQKRIQTGEVLGGYEMESEY